MLLVTANGSELLSDYADTDRLILCGTGRQDARVQATG
jgi:hypothetical protein